MAEDGNDAVVTDTASKPVGGVADHMPHRQNRPMLEEKLSWQKKQRELEGKRTKLRRELFERQDEVEAQRNGLIEQLEQQLGQRVEERTLFTVEWEMN